MANPKRKRANSDAHGDGNDQHLASGKKGSETKVVRPRKKGRKEPRLARKLQAFADMPVDVIYEVRQVLRAPTND